MEAISRPKRWSLLPFGHAITSLLKHNDDCYHYNWNALEAISNHIDHHRTNDHKTNYDDEQAT